MYGELADDERRIVALAGAIAERIDKEPAIAASMLVAALRFGPDPLGVADAELAAGFDESDVEACLAMVRKLWREIASEAEERFAIEVERAVPYGVSAIPPDEPETSRQPPIRA